MSWRFALALVLGITAASVAVVAGESSQPRLPLPGRRIPALPRLRPTVVTAGGQRLLLAETEARVWWDKGHSRLAANRAGWWIINYPLGRVRGFEGATADGLTRRLFGRPRQEVKNWYLRLPGAPSPEPAPPTGPAPIEVSPRATLFVDGRNRAAADTNAGTSDAPFKTIQAAVAAGGPGVIVRVAPGIYRESVTIGKAGEPGRPFVIEGVRDSAGNMPVITGNDPFPAHAWQPVADAPGVYRADVFSDVPGSVSVEGRSLIERSYYRELAPGEYCLNFGSREASRVRVDPEAEPRAGEPLDGRAWRRAAVDRDGFLDLARLPGGAAASSVYYAVTWVWVEPKAVAETWDPRFPQPTTKRVDAPGDFRAGRQTGSKIASQLNRYRVWANGERLPSVVYITPQDKVIPARPSRNYGQKGDRIEDFQLRQGWNRLLFQFDTTLKPKRTRFKFLAPKGINEFVSRAAPPGPERAKPGGPAAPYVSEYLVAGPFRSESDRGVYVRLPSDADPNTTLVDLATRGSVLVKCEQDHVHFRGFEVRHGAQFQQRSLVAFHGAGCLVEGCLLRDSEVSGLTLSNPRDQSAEPSVARGNWIVNTGHTGIGAQHSSTQLTPENQTDLAPGRGRLIIEHNWIRMTNWAAYPPFWASGGMKLFRLTGCVVRYNRIEDCFGPGIWLDWEHYNNRLEGNLIHSNWSFGIGIEASPGPNLVANNLIVGMRPGFVWFRWGILDWSTARTAAVHNTIDGRWCPLPAWFDRKGTDGIFIGLEGGPDRRTRWAPIAEKRQDRGARAVSNLVLGCSKALHPHMDGKPLANYSYKGTNARPLPCRPSFVAASPLDYRLAPSDPMGRSGVTHDLAKLVRHDFYGLLRHDDRPRSVGAFRPETDADQVVLEAEFTDGTTFVGPIER